jgi:hypothetical protein
VVAASPRYAICGSFESGWTNCTPTFCSLSERREEHLPPGGQAAAGPAQVPWGVPQVAARLYGYLLLSASVLFVSCSSCVECSVVLCELILVF